MARIDDLIGQVADKTLKQRLLAAVADMKRRQRFGLVFEEHIRETTTLAALPVHAARPSSAGRTHINSPS